MKKNKNKSLMKRILIPLSALMLTSLLGSTQASTNRISPLGINTNEAMDINASVPFINLFKLALRFEDSRPWLTKGNVVYDKDGWPRNLNGGKAGTRFISNLPGPTLPHGVYTVLYEGDGKLKYGVDAKLMRHSPGKDLVRIRPGKNGRISASLAILKTNPNNHVRNIRVLLPGGICHGNPFRRVNSARDCGGRTYLSFEKYHNQLVFNPDYLNFMKDFKVLRFMNMSGITRNDLKNWNDRPQVSQATWGGKEGIRGVPLEIMVKLANTLNADPWFSLPHRADNYFMTKYAQYVKENLKPGLKAYIEYTNEAWNGIFTQAHYMKNMGVKERLDRDKDIAGYKFFSKRSVEMFQIWERVFGNTNRFVRVMGAMTTNANLTHMLLGYREAYKYTDALAIAPYFYASQKDTKALRSVDQTFKILTSNKNKYSIQNILKYVKNQGEICNTYGVDMIAYEGGQHLVAYGTHTVREGPNPHIIRANKDNRMAQLYYRFLKGWKAAGGKLFVAFSAPRQYTWIGSWGVKEYITQKPHTAPKYRALMAFSKGDRCWWHNCSSTGPITRMRKPTHNPGTKTMARLFNPIGRELANYRDPGNRPATAEQLAVARRIAQKNARAAQLAAAKERAARAHKVAYAKSQSQRPLWQAPNGVQANQPIKRIVNSALSMLKGGNRSASNPYEVAIHKVKNPRQIFSSTSPHRLTNIINGQINNGNDLAAGWQAHWDNNYLHVKVDISDDKFVKDSPNPWGDDSIELYIDADGSRTASYDGKNDFQFIYRWKDQNVGLGANSPKRSLNGIKHHIARSNNRYSLTTSIPWRTLGVTPRAGQRIGIDIHINDDDTGQSRDGKIAWNATRDNSWKSPSLFGQVILR